MRLRARIAKWLLVGIGGCCGNANKDTEGTIKLVDAQKIDTRRLDDGGRPLEGVKTVTNDNCHSVCGAQDVNTGMRTVKSCKPSSGSEPAADCVFGNEGTCVGGRAPPGLKSTARASTNDGLGAWLARMAHLEMASVLAFAHLERELVAHGAPARLVRAAQRAARDEVRHAEKVGALARARGGVVAPVEVATVGVRRLVDVAIENAVEGCVSETWGAIIATHEAQTAADPELRVMFAEIARDETFHAELAWHVDAWVRTRLSEDERRTLDQARGAAFARLCESVAERWRPTVRAMTEELSAA